MKTENWRRPVQIFFLVLITLIAVNHTLAENGKSIPLIPSASLHAVCPFGGVVTIYKLISEGSFVQKLHESTLVLGIAVLAAAILVGPAFCGWICPTGALQEFSYLLLKSFHRKRKRQGYPYSRRMLVLVIAVAVVFLAWMAYLSATRVFFVEDASIYWSEALVILLFVLVWKLRDWDKRLRRLRIISFWIIVASAVAALRITSPVHFGFSKVYDPASVLATVMVFLAALAVPHVWCRYMCPWREAIAWAAKHSVRKLVTDFTKCIHCGKCTEVCGVDAVVEGVIDRRECHMCFRCVDTCPTQAIGVKDQWRQASCDSDCKSCSSPR